MSALQILNSEGAGKSKVKQDNGEGYKKGKWEG